MNRASVQLNYRIATYSCIYANSTIIRNSSIIHDKLHAFPAIFTAYLNTGTFISGNFASVHSQVGTIINANSKIGIIYNLCCRFNSGNDSAAALIGKINHALGSGVVADSSGKRIVRTVIGIDEAAGTAGRTVLNYVVLTESNLSVPCSEKRCSATFTIGYSSVEVHFVTVVIAEVIKVKQRESVNFRDQRALFTCKVTVLCPYSTVVSRIRAGNICNLTGFSKCGFTA